MLSNFREVQNRMTFYVTGSSPAYTMAMCLSKGWAVRFTCTSPDCLAAVGGLRHTVTWGEPELRAQPPEVTLGDLADRAVCSVCGGRVGHVSTRAGHWIRSAI